MKKITTQRLVLEPLTEEHAGEMFRALADPIIYTFLHQRPPFTEEELRARYRFLQKGQSPDGRAAWLSWIVRDGESAAPLGVLQAERYVRGVAGLSIVLTPASWKRGYAREALASVIHELAKGSNVHGFFATMSPRNDAALRLFEGLGFQPRMRAEFDLRAVDNGDLIYALGRSGGNPQG